MSIFENINKSIKDITEVIEHGESKAGFSESLVQGLETFYGSTLVPRMKQSEYLKSATGWVYGCVNVIADELAAIELRLMRFKNGDLTEVDEHDALDVIYRANNAMTKFDLFQLTGQYLELTGEAPWFISFKGNKPDQILLLRPDRLTVKPGTDGELIGGYKYKIYNDRGFTEIDLEPWEVIPLKYADPDQPLRGKGPLQAAALTFDLDNYGEKWNAQFFKNSASPASALYTDKILSKDVRERLNKKLKEKYEGVDNAHKTIVLENGLKWQSISLSQKDMDFIEQQRFSRDKILAIFRVPRTALGLTDDVNRANAEATDYVFAKRTIRPKMQRIVEQLNEFFLPLFGQTDNLFFDYADPVPENKELIIKEAQAGVQSGFMTINEARELMNLDPIEGGDVLRDPSSFILPPGDPTQQNSIKVGKTSKKKIEPSTYQRHLGKSRARRENKKELKKKIIQKAVEEAVVPVIFSMLKKKVKKGELKKKMFEGSSPEEVKESKLKFQDKQLNVASQYEAKVVSKLNSLFEIQKDIILRGLESGDKMKLDEKIEVPKYLELLKPTMMKLMREQSDLAFQIVGVSHPFNDDAKAAKKPKTFLQRLADYFERRAFTFATQVVKETNKQLRETFKEGTTAGESIPQLKKRVSELFAGMESYRSERIARTETILASNFSTEEAYKESGVVEAKEWLTTRDERTDDECADLDGKIIPLGSKFFDGDYFSGQYPPLHANCRCTLIPVVKP